MNELYSSFLWRACLNFLVCFAAWLYTNSFVRYYDFDDAVMRELIGKKPSSKNRKELDDVCDKTGVLIRSCRYVHVEKVGCSFYSGLER